jgi:hypothetical protein
MMSAQPVYHHGGPRVPRSIDGIGAALAAAERMAFYRELGPVEDPFDREAVLSSWWLKAMSTAYGPDRSGYRAAVADVLTQSRITDAAEPAR